MASSRIRLPLLSADGRAVRSSSAVVYSLVLATVAAVLCIAAVTTSPHGPVSLVQKSDKVAETAAAALKDTGLFWGDALTLSGHYDDDEQNYKTDPGDEEDAGLHAEADDALALCDEVAANQLARGETPMRCVHRVVSKHDTRFTNTPAGRNEWEQDHWKRSLDKIIDQFQPETEGIMEDGVITHVPVYDRSSFMGYKQIGRQQLLAMRPGARRTRSKAQARQQALFAAQGGGQNLWDVMPEIDVGGSPLWQQDPPYAAAPSFAPYPAPMPCSFQASQVSGGEWKGAYGAATVGAAPQFTGCGFGGASVTAGAAQQVWYPYPALPAAPAPYFAPPAPPPAVISPAMVTTVPQAPVAQVSPAVTVEQPFASASHLSTEEDINLGCGQEAEEEEDDGSEKYNVQVVARTRGCGCNGGKGAVGKSVWNGELDVQPVDCVTDVQEVK